MHCVQDPHNPRAAQLQLRFTNQREALQRPLLTWAVALNQAQQIVVVYDGLHEAEPCLHPAMQAKARYNGR